MIVSGVFFFSSRRRHTRCALVTGVQTCALPILMDAAIGKDYVMPLAKAFARLQTATAVISERGMKNADEAGAASWDYLNLFALVALGFMWAKMAKVAKAKLAEGAADKAFNETKLVTASIFDRKSTRLTYSHK